jgi:hypothetical protein
MSILAKPDEGCNISKRDVEGVAVYRSRRGLEVAERLEAVARSSGSVVASAVAFRLHRCADERNIWTAQDLHSKDWELFDGTGSLFACGNRLCPSCSAAMARANRRQGRDAINRLNQVFDKLTQFRLGLRWRSLVLTMPLMKGADVTDSIARINDAFRRLTNRKFWKSRVRGGIKSVEFTVRPEGFHAHIHLLVLSGFMPINAEWEKKSRTPSSNLQAEMKHCLEAAGATVAGVPVVAIFDVKRQGERHHNDKSISLDRALLETCKYLTKSESWDKIPDAQLVKVAEVKRWRRMFELLGAARLVHDQGASEPSNKSGEIEATTDQNAKRTLLNTLPLSNGGHRVGTKPERSATWRQELQWRSFDDWCGWMEEKIARVQKFRDKQLKTKFPYAVFTTLSDGVKVIQRGRSPFCGEGFSAIQHRTASSLA